MDSDETESEGKTEETVRATRQNTGMQEKRKSQEKVSKRKRDTQKSTKEEEKEDKRRKEGRENGKESGWNARAKERQQCLVGRDRAANGALPTDTPTFNTPADPESGHALTLATHADPETLG